MTKFMMELNELNVFPAPEFDGIWDLIDFILDCVEFPREEERFRKLPTVEGKNLREFAREEFIKLIDLNILEKAISSKEDLK